jgi:hypothetical protein
MAKATSTMQDTPAWAFGFGHPTYEQTRDKGCPFYIADADVRDSYWRMASDGEAVNRLTAFGDNEGNRAVDIRAFGRDQLKMDANGRGLGSAEQQAAHIAARMQREWGVTGDGIWRHVAVVKYAQGAATTGKAAERWAEQEARTYTCEVCGRLSGTVRGDRAITSVEGADDAVLVRLHAARACDPCRAAVVAAVANTTAVRAWIDQQQ